MSIRQPFLLLAALACALPPAWAQDGGAQAWTLSQALAAARDNSDVAQARSALAAARADVQSADHAPAPVLTAKASQMDLQHGLGPGNVLTGKRIDKSLGVDWTWERGGKRGLRTQAARSAAEAAQADVEDTQVQQLQAALAAYYDLMATQEKLQETTAIERSAAALARMADLRVQAGDASAQDAARTHIEAERVQADVQAARLAREQAALTLAQLTAQHGALQAGGTAWPAPTPPQESAATGEAALQALADARADVRAATARVQAAQAALDGASALRKADVTLGASLDHYPGTSNRPVELRLQVPLNWGYRFEGETGRAQAELTRAQDALDNTRRLALLDLRRLQQTAQAAAARALRYDSGILPRARQVAESAELAYRKGALPLTDVLDAQRTLRATVLEALDARADYAKAQGAWLLRTQPQALLP
jgi:cobalt-zinc-cadmium efflux system outer membrane protein